MLDWLAEGWQSGPELNLGMEGLRLILALLLGGLVALCCRLSRRDTVAPPLLITLVLLTPLIALVVQVIGNSVARAFSLVGALSIVRFRTVVEDTRDTTFVIFAVALGMALGAGQAGPVLPGQTAPTLADQTALAFLGLVLIGSAAVAMRFLTPVLSAMAGWTVVVRLGLGRDPETMLEPVLAKYAASRQVISIATARQGAALDVTYHIQLRPGVVVTTLAAELNRLEDVQSVELRQR